MIRGLFAVVGSLVRGVFWTLAAPLGWTWGFLNGMEESREPKPKPMTGPWWY